MADDCSADGQEMCRLISLAQLAKLSVVLSRTCGDARQRSLGQPAGATLRARVPGEGRESASTKLCEPPLRGAARHSTFPGCGRQRVALLQAAPLRRQLRCRIVAKSAAAR